MLRLLSLDPGLMTGAAWWAITDTKITLDKTGEYEYLNGAISAVLHGDSYDVVVGEAYIISAGTAKKTSQPWSLKVLGAAENECLWRGMEYCKEQTAANVKGFVTDKRLHDLGLYNKHSGGHARDAVRHGVYWIGARLGAKALERIVPIV